MADEGNRRSRKHRQSGSARLESDQRIVNQENINIMDVTEYVDEDPNRAQMELRQKYTELIDNCQTYQEKEGIEQDLKEKMAKNITEGNELFKKIGAGGPGEMYMAFLHTKMCSGMILSKTETIGTSLCGFTFDGFIFALLTKGSRRGTYDASYLCKWINKQGNFAQRSVSGMKVILGAFDRSSISVPPEVKEKKQRAPRKRPFEDDGTPVTQHEEVELSQAQRAKKDKDSPEAQSQEILRILAKSHEASKAPVNLNEFVMGEKLPEYFQNLFHVSFLVRDGFVSVKRKKRKDRTVVDSDLLISPEKPPEQTSGDDPCSSGTRSQHIVSFNAATFKALAAASQGDVMIKQPNAAGNAPVKGRKKR
ncbi:unnamed protein product [Allacma fusca]|uniref:Non-structural maintenance of chromosomes element 4 n=1 Tax=Allacma fusca TaxID=39272 RepID=A0A8J2Q4T9_9HEXA|nr:unnamed protein product [Allacma fusca]